jgi:hypothetical protein
MNAKKKWIASFILSSVLIFGVAVGSVGTLIFLGGKIAEHRPVDPVFNLKKDHYIEFVMKRMDHELHLSEEQRVAIRKEMQLTAKEFRELHGLTGKKMYEIIQKGQDKIKAYLTPEQIKEFEENIAKRHFRMKMHHSRGDRDEDDEHGGGRSGRNRDDRRNWDDLEDFPPPPPPEE